MLQPLPVSALPPPLSLRPCHSQPTPLLCLAQVLWKEDRQGYLLGGGRGWGLAGNTQDCGCSQSQKATASAEKDCTLTEGRPSIPSSNVTSSRSRPVAINREKSPPFSH